MQHLTTTQRAYVIEQLEAKLQHGCNQAGLDLDVIGSFANHVSEMLVPLLEWKDEQWYEAAQEYWFTGCITLNLD